MGKNFYFWSLLEVKTFILDDFEHPVEIFFHVASRKGFKSLGCEREVMNWETDTMHIVFKKFLLQMLLKKRSKKGSHFFVSKLVVVCFPAIGCL